MRQSIIKITSIFLIGFVIFLLGACAKKKSASNIDVWVESSTSKVFQNIEVEDKSNKEMNIISAKNEYEGANLLMYARKDVESYTVSVSDLVNGNYAISKENIDLYNVKYIDSSGISTKYNNDSLPIGSKMPDAILPFSTAIEYGENRIDSGNNQAIYIEIYVPEDTVKGTYTGLISLTADSENYSIPLTLKVYDVVIPDEPSTQNYFARWSRTQYESAELDGSDEFDEILFNQELKYRMSSALPFEGIGGTERYVELLRKYYHASGFSAYKLYYEPTYSTYNDMAIAFNTDLEKEYLTAIIKASLEDETNYLSKAFFYFSTFVDEPGENPDSTWDKVHDIAVTCKKFLTDLRDELDIELFGSENYDYYQSTVRDTLINIPNIIPGSYYISSLEEADAMDITACTVINRFNTEEGRENLSRTDGLKSWWYTCINPQYPYPNLLANSYLQAPRIISWMQKAYDIDGFLIWATFNYTTGDNDSSPIVDNYSSLTETMTYVSDGKIFYPGYPYGIKGAVASLRAVSYRDGMEDYEVLQMLYDKYAEYGLDASIALESLYNKLFSGTVYESDHNVFDSIREELFEMLEDSTEETALLYKSIEIENDKATVKFVVPNEEAIVLVNDEQIERNSDGIYTVNVSSENGDLTITVKANGKTKKYTSTVIGKYTLISDFESKDNIVSVNKSSSTEISSDVAYSGNSSLKITLQGENETYNPRFRIDASNFKDMKDVSTIIMSIYVEEDIKLSVVMRYGKITETDASIKDLTLKKGWNYVEIELPTSIRELEDITELCIYAPAKSEDGVPVPTTIYLDNLGYRTGE